MAAARDLTCARASSQGRLESGAEVSRHRTFVVDAHGILDTAAMEMRVLVLGAGFGGMEFATTLSEALGAAADVTLIDKNDSFVFGYSKLDVMFGHATPEAVRLP